MSDNSSECSYECAFLLTEQNRRYLEDARSKNAPILTPEALKKLWKIDGIKLVGITGTNGKTTTAAAIYSLLLDLGEKVALQGTRGFFIDEARREEKSLTTPPLLSTLHHLKEAKEAGCGYFVMEVSSHAIAQNRIEGLDFALKIYTNLTQDHLDYHGDFETYRAVKSGFFADESMKLINKDAKKIEFNPANCYTYALDLPASFNILAYSLNNGITGAIRHFDQQAQFFSPMQGFFNLYNLLAAISAVSLLTAHTLERICEEVENFAGVSGRMEVVSERPLVIVDFAHTPDGMEKVLDSLKEKEISLVFGAGGDRDRSKRPLMGRVANRYAKKIYLTSDNPRNENPMAIIEEIYAGIGDKEKVAIVENRKEAIFRALEELEEGEVLMILGKGDESYQEIGGEKIPFDDRETTKQIIKEKFNT